MNERFDIGWELQGDVNGEPFQVSGSGWASTSTGENVLRLEASPRFPEGFDAALSQFICNFVPAGYAAASSVETPLRDAVERELFVSPARIARVFDAAGEECVRLEALTAMRVEGRVLRVTNWLSGFSRLASDVVATWGHEVLVPAGPMRATGTAHFALRLADGTSLDGLTVVPYRFDRADVMPDFAIRSISQVQHDRKSETVMVLSAISKWTPITVAAAH